MLLCQCHLGAFQLYSFLLLSINCMIFLYISLSYFSLLNLQILCDTEGLTFFIHTFLFCIFFLLKYLFFSIYKLKASVLDQTFSLTFLFLSLTFFICKIMGACCYSFLCVCMAKKASRRHTTHMGKYIYRSKIKRRMKVRQRRKTDEESTSSIEIRVE